jgi:MarR-like DNA-binding transcriptional regulator SgrR of sgrS sRNA
MQCALLSRILILPDEICVKENLPSKHISSGYIKKLWISEINSDKSLRSLHHLNKDHLFPSHFSLMNVAKAVQLFSIKTAAALEKAVHLRQISKEALTTAWFVRFINEWFILMTARHVKKKALLPEIRM